VKRLRWDSPVADRDRPVPKHPYRDTAILYGVLAVLVVVIAYATGGSVFNAAITAAFVFVIATLWSWRSWRNRIRDQAREANRPQ
jgi:ABC-type bacteriocin/lantibiotic exporter with double-glycine peptidase domain